MKPKPKSTLPRLLIVNIARYLELNSRRLELQRMANAIKEEESQLASLMLDHARAAPGRKLSKGKHTLTIKTSIGSVAWKKEFIRELGADAANAIVVATPTRESINVT